MQTSVIQCGHMNTPILQAPGSQKSIMETPSGWTITPHTLAIGSKEKLQSPNTAVSQPPTPEVMSHVPPRIAVIIPNVRIPAPAFSPVVIGNVLLPSVPVEELPVPALESPTLVPPVLFVTKTFASSIRFDCRTSSADICWPTPFVPSQVLPSIHLKPQALENAVPSHCSAAAAAEVWRSGLMVLYVKGADLVVAASQREK